MTAKFAAVTLFLLVGCVLATRAGAEPPVLDLPVDCAMGEDCFVQNYFDHDPGPGFADQTCGPLGYDGHDGIDFGARSMTQMRAGIAVLAAAPGVVVGVRNDMPDISVADIGREALAGRDAGNGVRIDHGDGWFTQYAHMKQGSVLVHVGEEVSAGQPLGEMGLSGNTEFPHLHLSVMQGLLKIDPFVGVAQDFACGEPGAPMWSDAALAELAYVPGAVLTAGFAPEAADYGTARNGGYDAFSFGPGSPALVLWAELFGVRRGDRIRLQLAFPQDLPAMEDTVTMERDRARQFQFIGRRRPDAGWPSGNYHGQVDLLRTVDGSEQTISTYVIETRVP